MAEPSSHKPFLASPAIEDPVQIELVSSHAESLTCRVKNDLAYAVEVKLEDSDVWEVLYPTCCLELDASSDLQVSVRLRDDAEIRGVCETARPGITLCTSTDFGPFYVAAATFIIDEKTAALREAVLREDRKREMGRALTRSVDRAWVRTKSEMMYMLAVVATLLLALMIFCTVWAFREERQLQAAGLGLAATLLCCCTCGAMDGSARSGQADMESVRAVRPSLAGVGRSNAEYFEPSQTLYLLYICLFVISCICTAAMTVAFRMKGFVWQIVLLWLFPLVAGCCFCCNLEDQRRACCCLSWPELLARWVGCHRVIAKLKRPGKEALQRAILDTNQKTIVFEGNVIPGRNTVSSWPGKYESAWDTLVKRSRQDGLSAAVVFLPQGSEHFGVHDEIPKEDANGLPPHLTRGCWCIPLYGEEKPWGCRWWSRWIENIERAVEQGATLEVYYFNKMVGKGKVQSFITAGEEHLRREEIFNRKSDFKKSDSFLQALQAGLGKLPTDKGPDSSSPYSREEHRLFLSWLPEQDRRFLEESEGLGNSQKAEVAWLERKGYDYVEKEVDALAPTGPATPATSSSVPSDSPGTSCSA
ncbi:unnamed protein product [Symbiodinium natans]|uniref:Uncharacterized protein n=1 Tax=Symbiodinium natans TaxID=878477 RepID=A0A812NAD4_9DINO|nr:unnamed protein product [Symbiodinium natans]